jgi:acetoacetate decarboxylase
MAAERSGRLDPLTAGFSAPVDAPLYSRHERGWVYRDSRYMAVTSETDEEPFLDILPAPLAPAHSPPRVTIVVLECRNTAFGDYNEIKHELAVEFEGRPHRYCSYIMVSALDGALAPDAALAMGREVMGVPKKIARIEVRRDAGHVVAMLERPQGVNLMTVGMAARESVDASDVGLTSSSPTVNLRLIPSVDGGPPSVAELVTFDTTKRVDPDQVWRGPGYVHFGVPSADDPWHLLPARRVLQAVAWRGDLDIPASGAVLLDYTTRRT